MSDPSPRTFVDPAAAEAEAVFQRMMARMRTMTADEIRARFVACGLMNADGTWKLPEGDPCVTIVR